MPDGDLHCKESNAGMGKGAVMAPRTQRTVNISFFVSLHVISLNSLI